MELKWDKYDLLVIVIVVFLMECVQLYLTFDATPQNFSPSPNRRHEVNDTNGDYAVSLEMIEKYAGVHSGLVNTLRKFSAASRYVRNTTQAYLLGQVVNDLNSLTITNLHLDRDISRKVEVAVRNTTIVTYTKATELTSKLSSLEQQGKLSKTVPLIIVAYACTGEQRKLFEQWKNNSTIKIICSSAQSVSLKIHREIFSTVTSNYIIIVPQATLTDIPVVVGALELFLTPLVRRESDVVGISVQSDGHWDTSCYLMRTLRYQHRIYEGYDHIDGNGNPYCDYVSGPLVMRRDLFSEYLKQALQEPLKGVSYLDLFQYLSKRRIIAKVLLQTERLRATGITWANVSRDDIKPFMIKHGLNSFISPGKTDEFTCKEANTRSSSNGLMKPKCLIDELNQLAVTSVRLFEKHSFEYELDGGTVVGSAKLSDTLPWEKDHDMMFRSKHIRPLLKVLKGLGYKIATEMKNFDKCLNTYKYLCGNVTIYSKNWFLELWGQNQFASDLLTQKAIHNHPKGRVYVNATRSQLRKEYFVSHVNPGRFSRKRYGLDVTQHAKHWRDLGSLTSFMTYEPGKWTKCKVPGHHACFDNFLGDGNRQYRWLSED